MAKINTERLLKEFEFYSRLIEDHEATTKNAQLKPSCTQNSNNLLPQKPNVKYESHPYKINVNRPSSSFNQNHTFHKTNHLGFPDKRNRVLINKSAKNKYVLQKSQNSNKFPVVGGSNIKSNVLINNASLVPVKKDLQPEVNERMQLIEEIVSVTQMIKKKTSESAKLSSTFKDMGSFSKYKTVNGGNVLPTNKLESNISSRSVPSVNACINTKQSEAAVNLNPVPLKQFNGNKYRYKKLDSKINKPLNTTLKNKDPLKNVPKRRVVFSLNKTSISETENANKNKHLSPDKQNRTVKLNMTKNSVLLSSNASTKSFTPAKVKAPTQLNFKTSSMYKSPKISKLNSCGSRYTKVNKSSVTPKTNSLRRVIMPKSTKKINKKINTKYKVINRNRTPCSKKSSNSKSKINRSVTVEESDSFLQELNDSAFDKLEKDLLAISAAFTATPISNKGSESCSTSKLNLKPTFHKTSLKKTKPKVSKYKIVNGSNLPNCHQGKKQNIASLRTSVKKLSCSKYKLVNKNLKPVQILTPARRASSVLVKRLFKSKNTLINKNASPTSFSAKIIKSKYFTPNKRKFPLWQKNDHRIKVPVQHGKFKGYYIKTKLPYQKGFQNALLWKNTEKFSSYHNQALSRQFSKTRRRIVCKRKLKNGYAYSPVVIGGVKYSINSSGKALKKLFTPKGHMTKSIRKTYMKTPENFKSPMPTSNLASRALHRSINRIISASTKKNLTKVNTYCMFYNRFGRCNKGLKCTYIHDPSKIAVCTRFLRGTCKVDGCPFSHEIAPGKMAVCSFFLVGACEKENCPYRHEELLPDAVLCKAFVQGYCPKGKECKKAHILVCPKYIQGECDKGSSCAFPHPPKKVKKNEQKDNEEVEKKPEDVFMEKVGRYFQAESSSSSSHNKSDESKANQCVPKQRKKLEEQPSFIPLFGTPQMSQG